MQSMDEAGKKQLVQDVKDALYCSKICSYAQGLNIIRAKSKEKGWDVNLGEISRIWKVLPRISSRSS